MLNLQDSILTLHIRSNVNFIVILQQRRPQMHVIDVISFKLERKAQNSAFYKVRGGLKYSAGKLHVDLTMP